jgi:tetratricopeptide (TPR) repeat protein
MCLVFLVAALYGRTASFGFTRTDDRILLNNDAAFIQEPSSLSKVFGRPFFPASPRGETYFRPVVTASFIVDAQWAGIAPRAFHLTNVALHVAGTCLLFLLLVQLGLGLWPSLIGAAVFAAHPALTEAVAWIPGRCDTLLGIGVLASTLLLIKFVEAPRWRLLLGHLLAYAFALLSKESAVALPAVLVGLLFLLPKGGRALRNPRLWLGWVSVAGCWVILRAGVAGGPGEGLAQRLANLLSHLPVLLMHLGKLVLPVNLAALASAKDTSLIPGLMAAVVMAAVVLLLRGRCLRLYSWGLAFFILFLLPSLPVSDFLILENRLYVPAMGIMVAIVAAAESLRAGAGQPTITRVAALAGVVIVLALATRTWSYSDCFHDPLSFTSQAVESSPHLALAHLNRGIVFQLDGRVEEAEREYGTALWLDPTLTVTHNNLGLIYLNRGDSVRAEAEFRREIELNPTYDKAFFNLGLALEQQGRLEPAATSLRQALNPRNDEARGQLQAVETHLGGGASPEMGAPGGGTPVALDNIPTSVLVDLYEGALKREPRNRQIRKAYADICAARRLPCAKEQEEMIRRLDAGEGSTAPSR